VSLSAAKRDTVPQCQAVGLEGIEQVGHGASLSFVVGREGAAACRGTGKRDFPLLDWALSCSAEALMNDQANPPAATDEDARLAALDASIQRGLSDADNGRVHDLEDVAAALDAKYAAMAARADGSRLG